MTAFRIAIPAVAGVVLVALTSCSEPPKNSSESSDDAAAAVGEPSTVAENLEVPWSVAFHGDTALLSERDSGRILELKPDGHTREVGTIAGVEAEGEGGLLGIAVGEEKYLYTYLTAADGNRIQRHDLRGEAGSFELGDTKTVIDGLPSAGNHNGGRIAFGPDGMLYATVGDAGDRDSAQDLDALSGKILRLEPDGKVPSDNPFPGSLVYSYGHRNPQGIAWAEDGTMYASEFGQNTWDELNVIEPGGNYGWPTVEGAAEDGGGEFVDPVQQWEPSVASPSGIAIAGETLYIANLRGERLRVVPLAEPATSTELFTGDFGRLRDVVVTPDGALWILTNNTDGRGDPDADDDRILSVEAE